MTNKEKYDNSFVEALSVDKKKLSKSLEYNSIQEWDSIGHMSLISELEKNFQISIDTDDVIDFSSYQKGISILKKYKVDI